MTIIKTTMPDESPVAITFRPGTAADSWATFKIFQETVLDLGQRLGVETISGGQDEAALARMWDRRRPLFEHLASTAAHFWLAESEGRPIGYARSVLRDGLYELTEFFVLPGQQEAGVGGELLARAFPPLNEGVSHQAIIATPDTRAQVRYLKRGVYPRFATSYFSRPQRRVAPPLDPALRAEPISATPETLAALGAVDVEILGHQREVDHRWLLANRQGYLYRRGNQLLGYGYVSHASGPFALLAEADFPAVLAHAEAEATARDFDFGVEVPLINRAAIAYLLEQGFRMDAFIALVMFDQPFGKFDHYIFPSPPFFI